MFALHAPSGRVNSVDSISSHTCVRVCRSSMNLRTSMLLAFTLHRLHAHMRIKTSTCVRLIRFSLMCSHPSDKKIHDIKTPSGARSTVAWRGSSSPTWHAVRLRVRKASMDPCNDHRTIHLCAARYPLSPVAYQTREAIPSRGTGITVARVARSGRRITACVKDATETPEASRWFA
jgi:hypothetical protein